MPFPVLHRRTACTLCALALARFFPAAAQAGQSTSMFQNSRTIRPIDYRGWTNSILLSNGLVEAIVVPAIGRVMQFRFVGEDDGPIWENPAAAAGNSAHDPSGWANFGGDKAWPSPQSDWERVAGRNWPPPAAFDGSSMRAVVEGTSAVTLESQVAPGYGIRVRRRIELAADRPVMTITTTYEKVSGPPADVAVWVITQVKDPVLVCVPIAKSAAGNAPFVPLSDGLPAGLHRDAGMLSFTRDSGQNRKIGVRAGSLVWVGATSLLRIDSAMVPGGRYPDAGCSSEIYTNAGPLAYVELEFLGPLSRLSVGEKIERVSSYTLARRSGSDPKSDAARLLAADPATPPVPAGRIH